MKVVPSKPDYAVTEDGRVFRVTPCDRFRCQPGEMKQRVDRDGYRIVGASMKVHRLVAEAYLPNPKGKPQVAHINGDRADNRVENLRWATAAENLADMDAHGTRKVGSAKRDAKLTEAVVAACRKLKAKGCSIRFLAAIFGVERRTMGRAVSRSTWKHVGTRSSL